MKPITSSFLVISCFLFSFGVFSQSDTTCIGKRWIAVKSTEHNAVLFDTSTTILKTIRDLVHENKLSLYHQESYSRGYGSWYPIPLVQRDSSYIDYGQFESDIYNGIFTIRIQSDIPLVDEYGDNIIRTEPDGTQYFVYPEPEIHMFSLNDVVEIRIREEIYDYRADGRILDDFQPTGVSFFVQDSYEMRELFWVSIIELEDTFENFEDNPWYSFLKEKKYQGFQYMQVSCDDHLIRH